MALYARPSWKLSRQIVADVFVLGWTLAWWFTSRAADAVIRALADPSRSTEQAARAMQAGFVDGARNVETVPWAGPALRQPFDAAASGLQQVIDAAAQQVAAIEAAATWTGWLTFLIPVTMAWALWLPGRIRFAATSAAAARFIDGQADLDLLALRAMANRPVSQLAQISPDPLAAWRAGDREVIDQLADLELRRNGWRRPRVPRLPDPPALERHPDGS